MDDLYELETRDQTTQSSVSALLQTLAGGGEIYTLGGFYSISRGTMPRLLLFAGTFVVMWIQFHQGSNEKCDCDILSYNFTAANVSLV